MKTCCICGNSIKEEFGNNPYPLCSKDDFESECCSNCNELVIKARMLLLDVTPHIKPKINDNITIFWSKNSEYPINIIAHKGKFLTGFVTTIKVENNQTMYEGTWGNYPITDDDNFIINE